METAELAAVGISFYLHRDCAKMFRGAQKNQPGAGAKHRQSISDLFFQGIKHFKFPEKFSLYSAFPARQDQSVIRLV